MPRFFALTPSLASPGIRVFRLSCRCRDGCATGIIKVDLAPLKYSILPIVDLAPKFYPV